MSRKILAARVEKRSVSIQVPFTISRESLPSADFVFVSLQAEDGTTGLGECAPFPSLTHDDVAKADAAARALCDAIKGLEPVQALAKVRALRQETVRKSITAHVGVETALWDLHARQLGVPLAALCGSVFKDELETDITLPIMPATSVAGFWQLYRDYGFGVVKVKVKGRVDDDVALVRALLAAVPAGTKVTLDGNQGYRVDGAKELVRRLHALGVDPLFFEQPLPEDDWQGHAELARTAGLPICLDETVRTAADAIRAVREATGQIINIKIMKSGIEEALRIMQVAAAAGMRLMIGGMLESEVAMGTSLQLAAGTGLVRYADLDTPFFLTTPVTTQSPWHQRSARLMRGPGAGHGLVLAPAKS